jgi:hypothetical protein
MLGVASSTVAGRLMMALRCGVGFQMSSTASHTSREKSSSVAVKVSGLYSKRQWVSGRSSAVCLMSRAARTAMSITPLRSCAKTTRRNTGEVAL